jgi:hypothetical protein
MEAGSQFSIPLPEQEDGSLAILRCFEEGNASIGQVYPQPVAGIVRRLPGRENAS